MTAREPARTRLTEPMREHGVDLLFAVASIVAFGVLLSFGSELTFYGDEWAFIRGGSPRSLDWLLSPHNEHLSLVPKLLYGTMLSLVGLGTYLPYLGLLLVFHVATASAVYAYARRQVNGLIALAVAVLLLFLGSGGEDLLWAFQIGFLGATATGAWALVLLLHEPRPQSTWLIAVLLVAAVASAGVGLFFLAAAAGAVLLVPRLRPTGWVVVPAAAAYLAWYVLYAPERDGPLPGFGALMDFTEHGLANAVGQVSGLDLGLGLVLVVLLFGAAILDLLSGRAIRAGLIAGAAGLLAEFVVIGLARADGGVGLAAAPRYIYPAAVFILIALVGWLGGRDAPSPDGRLGTVVAILAILAVALTSNLIRLSEMRDFFAVRAQETLAGVALISEFGGSPAIPDDRGLTLVSGHSTLPGAAGLAKLTEHRGFPYGGALAPARVDIEEEALDRVLMALVSDAIGISESPLADGSSAVTLETVAGASIHEDGPCVVLVPYGPETVVDVSGPAGSGLGLTSDGPTQIEATVSLHGTFGADPRPLGTVGAGTTAAITLPDIGNDQVLVMRLGLAGDSDVRLCNVSEPPAPEAYGIDQLIIRPAESSPTDVEEPPTVLLAHDVTAGDPVGGCVTFTAGSVDPYVSVSVPDGAMIRVTPALGGPNQVFLGVGEDYSEADSRWVTLEASSYEFFMPEGSRPDGWAIRIDPPPDQETTMCALPTRTSPGSFE